MIRTAFKTAVSLALWSVMLAGAGAQTAPAPSFSAEVAPDFARGVSGDDEALARAAKRCEDALAKDPRHAEAMVWHGAATLAGAGRMFRRGDFARGAESWKAGRAEMDAAVALAPEDPAVLLVRGGTLLEGSKHFPEPAESRAMLETGLADYEKLAANGAYFGALSAPARGRLLVALGDGWERAGEPAKARRWFERAVAEAKGTEYEKAAAAALGN